MFECYDHCLRDLVNKRARIDAKTIRSRRPAPWYNHECRCAEMETVDLKDTIANCIQQMSTDNGERSLTVI